MERYPQGGDFVSYNLPPSFVDPWDDWLQNAIDCSRGQLGGNWLDAYLTCPIYRFSLSPGIAGKTAWLGIMMPSVDNVGRYFPLTFCAPIPAEENPFHAYNRYESWFNSTEKLALSTLTNGLDPQQINAILKQQATSPSSAGTIQQGHNKEQLYFNTPAIQQSLYSDTEIDPIQLDTILRERCFAYSTWHTAGSEAISPSRLTSQGLPPVESFVSLYDGKWEKWGWQAHSCTHIEEDKNSPKIIDKTERWNL